MTPIHDPHENVEQSVMIKLLDSPPRLFPTCFFPFHGTNKVDLVDDNHH